MESSPAATGPPTTAGLPRPFGPRFFERLLDHLYDGVYFVDPDRTILYWNDAAERITGYSREEVVGRSCYDNILCHTDCAGHRLCVDGCPLARSIADAEPGTSRLLLKHRDGHRIAVDVSVMPVRDESGRVVGGVEIFRDARPMLALEAAYHQTRELAEKDPLTGAVNRRHAGVILAKQAELLRRTGVTFSVIMADIDHFKRINDTFGHPAGDAALAAFVRCLERSCRQSDIVARMGGEEFLVILPGVARSPASRLAERVRAATPGTSPPELRGARMTVSAGVAEASRGESVEGLLARADAALYRAKNAGRDRVELG